MTKKPLPGCFVISRDMEFFHIGQDRLQDHGVFRRSDQAVRYRNDTVCPAGVEAGHRLAVFHADRELGFIAEPVRIFHTDDRGCRTLSVNASSKPPIRIRLLRTLLYLNRSC